MTANTPKIFQQLNPQDTSTVTVMYTVPAGKKAQVTLFVCNRDSPAEFFRIAVVPAGAVVTNARYIAYDTVLTGNGVFSVTGIGLDSGESLWVKSSLGNLSFTATGIEWN